MKKKVYLNLLFLFIFISFAGSVSAANVYVKQSATGSGNGADWTNAIAWSSVTPARGNTYYLADGTYAGKNFNTAYNNNGYIIIKKAVNSTRCAEIGKTPAECYGTSTGWSDSTMGSGQATFTSSVWFSTSYWIFDGVVGSMSRNPNDYGFKFIDGLTNDISIYNTASTMTNVTVSHITGKGLTGRVEKFFVGTSNTAKSINNITISHNLIDTWQAAYWATSGPGQITLDNWVFEYNICLNGEGYDPGFHGEWINNGYSRMLNQITRYNIFGSAFGFTGVIVANNGPNVNPQIYGNVFLNYNSGNGIITGTSAGTMSGAKVYNNVFIGSMSGWIGSDTSSTIAYNNLFYGMSVSGASGTISHNAFYSTSGTVGTNVQTGTGDPFVNLAGGDYHLKVATQPGLDTLGSPYDIDPDGVTRGSDGTWDRGAYEFGGIITPINANCGSSANTCSPGNVFNQTINATHFNWGCLGLNGGQNKTCYSILVPIAGECGQTVDSCLAGTYQNNTDDATNYLWQCNGLYGGSADYCSFDRNTIYITQTGGVSINVPQTGVYVLSAYVNSPDNVTNSFYVDFDAIPGSGNPGTDNNRTWDIYPNTNNFFIMNVSWRGVSCDSTCALFNPKNWTLSAGTHTLYINDRESTINNIDWVKLIRIDTGAPSATYYHPADTSAPYYSLSSSEVSNYISSYFTGSTSLTQTLYAMTLLQSGGSYRNLSSSNSCTTSQTPWSCWN